MTPSEAIFYQLSNTSAVTDLVGYRIYPLMAPKSRQRPWITYHQISVMPVRAMGADPSLQGVRMQISIYDDDYDVAENISAAVKAALRDFSGDIGSGDTLSVERIFFENETMFAEVDDETKLVSYQINLDFTIWHQ